jgi:thiol-disulfide isomerase/thioredoxin
MKERYSGSWYVPCREEIPEFIELQKKYSDKGFIFVGIAVDQKERAAAFSKGMGIII